MLGTLINLPMHNIFDVLIYLPNKCYYTVAESMWNGDMLIVTTV